MTRKTIEQRISLQGGKAIIAELQQLGAAGEAAFKQIGDAIDSASTPEARLTASLNNLKSVFKDTVENSEQLRTRFIAVGNAAGRTVRSFREMAFRLTAVAGASALVVGGLAAIARASVNAANEAKDAADALGLTVDQFTRLRFAANQVGIEDSKFSSGFTSLNNLLADAKKGSEEAISVLDRLNVAINDISVRKAGKLVPTGDELKPTEQVLNDIADALSKLPNEAEQLAFAIDIFGEAAGPDFVKLLRNGSKALRAQGNEAARLGLTFTALQQRVAGEFSDSLVDLGDVFEGLRNQIGLAFAPAATTGIRALTKIIDDNRNEILSYTDTLVRTAVPIIEDFFLAISGQDARVSNEWVLDARDAIISFGDAVFGAISGIIIPAYNLLVAAADRVADAINAVFGTELTGQELLIGAAILQLVGVFGVLTSTVGLAVSAFSLLFTFLSGPIGVAAFGVLTTAIGAALTAIGALIGVPALVVAAVVAAIAGIVIFWDEIVAGAQIAIDAIIATFNSIVAGAIDIFASFADTARRFWADFAAFAVGAWNSFGVAARAAWDGAIEIAQGAWARIRQLIAEGPALWSRFKDAAVGVWGSFRDAAQSAISFIASRLDSLIARIGRAVARLRAARSETRGSSGSGSGDGLSGFARGGRVRGPGTGTSDSILAWLSNDEYVVKAKAVRHYGQGVLAAINNMRLPKSTFKQMPKFASGGLVGAGAGAQAAISNPFALVGRLALEALPAFAMGGPVSITNMMGGLQKALAFDMPRFADGGMVQGSAGSPVTLAIGGEEFGPMMASDDTIQQLTRYASRRQLTSLGRKPGWYGS